MGFWRKRHQSQNHAPQAHLSHPLFAPSTSKSPNFGRSSFKKVMTSCAVRRLSVRYGLDWTFELNEYEFKNSLKSLVNKTLFAKYFQFGLCYGLSCIFHGKVWTKLTHNCILQEFHFETIHSNKFAFFGFGCSFESNRHIWTSAKTSTFQTYFCFLKLISYYEST